MHSQCVKHMWESTVPCCNLLIDGEVERFPTVPFLAWIYSKGICHKTSLEWWWCGRDYSVKLNGDTVNQSRSKVVSWSETFWPRGSLSVTKQFYDELRPSRSKRLTPTTTSLFSWVTVYVAHCILNALYALSRIHKHCTYVCIIAHTFCMCSRSTV